VYKRQIYQIAESNGIETFLPELECSSSWCDIARIPVGTAPSLGLEEEHDDLLIQLRIFAYTVIPTIND